MSSSSSVSLLAAEATSLGDFFKNSTSRQASASPGINGPALREPSAWRQDATCRALGGLLLAAARGGFLPRSLVAAAAAAATPLAPSPLLPPVLPLPVGSLRSRARSALCSLSTTAGGSVERTAFSGEAAAAATDGGASFASEVRAHASDFAAGGRRREPRSAASSSTPISSRSLLPLLSSSPADTASASADIALGVGGEDQPWSGDSGEAARRAEARSAAAAADGEGWWRPSGRRLLLGGPPPPTSALAAAAIKARDEATSFDGVEEEEESEELGTVLGISLWLDRSIISP